MHLSALKEKKTTRRGEIRKRKQDGKTFRGRSRRKMDEEFPPYRQNGKFRREKSRKWKGDTAGRSIREEGGKDENLGFTMVACAKGKEREKLTVLFVLLCFECARGILESDFMGGGKVAGEKKKALTNFSEQCGKSLLHGP